MLAANGRDILQGRLSQPPAAQFQKGGVVSNGTLNGNIIWGAHVSEEQKPVTANPYRDTISGEKAEMKRRAQVNPNMPNQMDQLFKLPQFEKGGAMNFNGATQMIRKSPDSATNRKTLLKGGADVTMYPLTFKEGGKMTDPAKRKGLLAGGADVTLYPLPFKHGGSIHIKPENRGKFNATKSATGKSTEELTHSSNPVTKKRAVFAQNAKKWHHADGGVMDPPAGGLSPLEKMKLAFTMNPTVPGGIGAAAASGVGSAVDYMSQFKPAPIGQALHTSFDAMTNGLRSVFSNSQMAKDANKKPVTPTKESGGVLIDTLSKGTPAHLDSGATPNPRGNNYLTSWGPQSPFLEQHIQNDAIKTALGKAKKMAPNNDPVMAKGGLITGLPKPQFGKYGLSLDLKRLGNANFGDKTVLPNVGLPRVRGKNPS